MGLKSSFTIGSPATRDRRRQAINAWPFFPQIARILADQGVVLLFLCV